MDADACAYLSQHLCGSGLLCCCKFSAKSTDASCHHSWGNRSRISHTRFDSQLGQIKCSNCMVSNFAHPTDPALCVVRREITIKLGSQESLTCVFSAKNSWKGAARRYFPLIATNKRRSRAAWAALLRLLNANHHQPSQFFCFLESRGYEIILRNSPLALLF